MTLEEYRRKRDFKRTPEPAAGKPSQHDSTFVVQKHAATSLHYDFRLRIGDALKSWAVPKGPSLDPREKRLAIEVEDHPVEYAAFEGVIPEGQYGSGTVMIWDKGGWSPIGGDPARSLHDGELKFNLEGERLKGRWVLVRTNYTGKQPQWLLIKEKDVEAIPGVHAETFATSVTTGRTMEEIRAGARPHKAVSTARTARSAAELTGARRTPMPTKPKPQLATPSNTPPEGTDWFHEVKFDGYRLSIVHKGESIKVLSRSGLDWSAKFPDLAAAVGERLRVDAVLDGEAVILDAHGVSDFQALQNALHSRRSGSIVYFAFDLPWCDGFDLTSSPLEQRRALLASLIGLRQEGRLRFSEHIEGNGDAAFARVCSGGLEGLVSKRKGSAYSQGRSPVWVKTKCFNQQEFVIGGFTAPEGARSDFGALLLGYQEKGTLRFAGKVGTGFSTETLKKLSTLLVPLVQERPAFANPPSGAAARGVTWVRPTLIAQVQFRDWTAEGLIRHTSFRGLREDIGAESVTRETSAVGSPSTPSLPRSAASSHAPWSRLTNPDRIVFPDRGNGYSLTKLQVAEYYESVSAWMLPHLANRPLAILRCPDGEGGKGFFQKHPAKGMPDAVGSVTVVSGKGTSEQHLCIGDTSGLLALVQMNALEFHPWGASADNIEHPDRVIFDLDPGNGVTWKQTVEGALMVRDALAQTKLRGFARVSGGKGIHVVVPIKPIHNWPSAHTFARAATEALVKLAPHRFVAKAGASNREGRIFIDYLRNARGATAIASYSLRARPGAPVSLLVEWEELGGMGSAHDFSALAVIRRLASRPTDPWMKVASITQTLPN